MMAPALWLFLLAALPAPEEASGRFSVRPATVAVGEPFQVVLEISHDQGDALVDAAAEPDPDASWVVLDTRREAAVPDKRWPGRYLTRRIWIVASLEPGSRHVTGAFGAPFESAGLLIEDGATGIEVLGVLGAGEDEPRPLQGFPDAFGAGSTGAAASLPWLPIGIGAAVVVAGLGWLLLRRRGRSVQAPALSPLQELDELRTEAASVPAAVRTSHFNLARLVRGATDRALARAGHEGLTDDEWLAGLQRDGTLGDEAQDELTRVLERCTAAKYGGHRPTDWALEETFAGARRLLEVVAAGSTGAAGGSGAGPRRGGVR